jgi:hypothetical protein
LPHLEAARGSLYNRGWLKSGIRHSRDRFSAEIVDQAQRMSAVWADEYLCTPRILPPEPRENGVNLIGALAASKQYPAVHPENADFE